MTYLDVAGAPVDAGRGLGGGLVDAASVAAEVRLVADDDDGRPLVAVLLVDDLIPQQLDLLERRLVVDSVHEDERVAGADSQPTHCRELVRTCTIKKQHFMQRLRTFFRNFVTFLRF